MSVNKKADKVKTEPANSFGQFLKHKKRQIAENNLQSVVDLQVYYMILQIHNRDNLNVHKM